MFYQHFSDAGNFIEHEGIREFPRADTVYHIATVLEWKALNSFSIS